MKKLIILLFIIYSSLACTPVTHNSISYLATDATADTRLQYLNKDGDLVSVQFKPKAEDDIWQYSFIADDGDIVFLAGKYKDIHSALKLMIKVNGKIYKQGSTIADTNTFLVVSGTIPYK